MAKKAKVKVELPSIESTTVDCAGCGKTLNLLENHFKIQFKPERAVIINQPQAEYEAIVRGEELTKDEILRTTDVDEEEDMVSYLGYRSGAGEIERVHGGCLVEWAKKRDSETVKLKLFRPGKAHYETVGRSSE